MTGKEIDALLAELNSCSVETWGFEATLGQQNSFGMTHSGYPAASIPPALRVAAGEDRFGEHRGLGISTIAFKVVPEDSSGLFILENTFHAKGGPARHLHYDQDEWFYALEGEFIVEVGTERFRLQPGDSLLAPRQVPHVWAYVGDTRGRILITFLPAGNMEASFER